MCQPLRVGTRACLRAYHQHFFQPPPFPRDRCRRYDIPDLEGDGAGLAEAAKAISSYFATFTRNGAPSAAGQPAWPRYETATRPVMLLNAQCDVVNDPDGEERQFR